MSKLTTTWWIVFYKDQLLLKKQNNKLTIPCNEQPPLPIPADTHVHEICILEGQPCKAFVVSHPIEESDEYCMTGLRASYDFIPLKQYHTAGKAFEILHWDQHSRFCPACGMPTEHKTPIMKKCPSCAYEIYPPISTAIIVLIRRGEEILLVHARNFRGTFYGLVAGFLEAGETLEQCVQREVMEETGLRVKNITYFGNQPWPYPSGLMVGFIADYESGEIKLQKDELSAGAFYSKENMPEIPRKLSIARKMIDWWLSNN